MYPGEKIGILEPFSLEDRLIWLLWVYYTDGCCLLVEIKTYDVISSICFLLKCCCTREVPMEDGSGHENMGEGNECPLGYPTIMGTE